MKTFTVFVTLFCALNAHLDEPFPSGRVRRGHQPLPSPVAPHHQQLPVPVAPQHQQLPAPVAPHHQQLPAPNRQNLICDPAIGKRSINALDSFPNLGDFYMDEETSDVKLVVNGTQLPAHRFVLMAKSAKFAEMLRSDPTKVEFDLGENSVDVFKILLKYFYTERFTLAADSGYRRAIEIYKTADEYGIDGLRLQIERTLATMIHPNNYIDIFKFADENHMHELVRLWMSFVFTNTQLIINDESFMNESVAIAQRVLGAVNAAPSYVLMQIRKLIEADPELEPQRFRSIVNIERCGFEDLLTLSELKVYDEKHLFQDMVNRYRALSAKCNTNHYSAPVRHVPRWISN